MARCTREHRERALDLYERYELSSADTIREISCSSPRLLRVRYRERLVERACGIESDRGSKLSRRSEEREARGTGPLSHARQTPRAHRWHLHACGPTNRHYLVLFNLRDYSAQVLLKINTPQTKRRPLCTNRIPLVVAMRGPARYHDANERGCHERRISTGRAIRFN
ncbi:hypothetical protein Corgl_0923 [Coriobacterium glomerans PW2]|uniref:Uncharacterized protein n=1 Tax=Coriobacterium glomerans (strain ATCC 49209 / DSM 20642 / JCM 10262 / PW2) TaxID=700015 RepID=F2N9K5_CORGP|nr:hypothetical protein Corgl_0923 [Coriobacterium glomerans PW2]